MTDWLQCLSHWATGCAPVLPGPLAMRYAMVLGWAVVLAWLGSRWTGHWHLIARRALALCLALSCAIPGPFSPTYWLGLALHAPSVTAVVLCGIGLLRQLWPGALTGAPSAGQRQLVLCWMLAGVALGYLLLLDTFALLPIALYAMGFLSSCLALMLALALLPFLFQHALSPGWRWRNAVLPCVLLIFLATRVPSGNVWDALLDPCLWIVLQLLLLHRLLRFLFSRFMARESAIRD